MLYIRGILLSKIFKLLGTIHQIQNLISIQVTALHEAMVLSFCKQSRFHKINHGIPSVGVIQTNHLYKYKVDLLVNLVISLSHSV